MKKIFVALFVVFAALEVSAQNVSLFGNQYDRNCVQAALANECRPSGREFASEMVRVQGVGQRVGSCAQERVAHCLAGTGNTTAPSGGERGGRGGRGGRR
ncbi:MAG: hypothetical protein FWD15_03785 [Alphaproteobacteria bacterium]|nr:hypothetical protein [Alphaproteobacteria bacterium]